MKSQVLIRWAAMVWAGIALCLAGYSMAANTATDALGMCKKISKKLASVNYAECAGLGFSEPRFYSVKSQPLLELRLPATAVAEGEKAPRILFLGGIHGDEYSSVSVSFKWLNMLKKQHDGRITWHALPLVNPDGMLKRRGSRVNANKVDLNRNFQPAKAVYTPLEYWRDRKKKRARYFPGHAPLSEPESKAVHQLIKEFEPDLIVSVHAPHGIVDFDGNTRYPPRRLGPLKLSLLGTYPGSLGNYAWLVRKIPVVTIELAHAGIMPKKREINRMWRDLTGWIDRNTGAYQRVAEK